MITALIAIAALVAGLVAGGWLGFGAGYREGLEDAEFRRSGDANHYWHQCCRTVWPDVGVEDRARCS
jgi:hypothetical protein